MRQMLKYGFMALFSIGAVQTTTYAAESRATPSTGHNTISDLSFYTHRRYYYIERLQKTIQLLTKIKYQVNQLQFLVRGLYHFRMYGYTFSHPAIRRNLDEIIRTRSLKPLFLIWDDFTIYKFLEDELFVEEFTQEIFVVTRSVVWQNMLQRSGYLTNTYMEYLEQCPSQSLEDCLLEIDHMTGYLEAITQQECQQDIEPIIKRDGNLQDIESGVSSEDVLQRFYVIRRLSGQANILHELEKSGILAALTDSIDEEEILKEFSRNEPLFIQAIISALIVGDTHAMRMHLDEFTQFKFLFDSRYTHSLLVSLFMIYIQILRSEMASTGQRGLTIADIQTLFEIYHRVDQLPVEEILGAIDLATRAIQKLAAQKQSSKGTIELFVSSWWSGFATLIAVLVKVSSVLFKPPKKVQDVEQ